jgi:hypothetical protein
MVCFGRLSFFFETRRQFVKTRRQAINRVPTGFGKPHSKNVVNTENEGERIN